MHLLFALDLMLFKESVNNWGGKNDCMLGQPQSISASAKYKNLKKMERSVARDPFKSHRLGPMSSKRQLTVPDTPLGYLYVHTALCHHQQRGFRQWS